MLPNNKLQFTTFSTAGESMRLSLTDQAEVNCLVKYAMSAILDIRYENQISCKKKTKFTETSNDTCQRPTTRVSISLRSWAIADYNWSPKRARCDIDQAVCASR